MVGIPDAIGDDRIVVAIVPTDPPSAPDAEHPVARATARALPGLIDAGVLPDVVVALPALPRSGRGRKLDRAALVAQLAPLRGPGDTLRVAVTGASGFVGGAVATALADDRARGGRVRPSARTGGRIRGAREYRMWDLLAGEPLAEASASTRSCTAPRWPTTGRRATRPCGSTATAPARSSRAFPGARLVHLSTSSVYDALTPSVDLTRGRDRGGPLPERLLRVEGARRGRGRSGRRRHPATARRLRTGRHDAASAHPRRGASWAARAARGRRRAAQPHAHRQPRVRGRPRARPELIPGRLQHRRRRIRCCSRRCSRSSWSDEASSLDSSHCPTAPPSPSRRPLEAAALVNRTRPRLTRYAVSQLGLERTFDLTAARTHLGYQPTPTTLDGAENW